MARHRGGARRPGVRFGRTWRVVGLLLALPVLLGGIAVGGAGSVDDRSDGGAVVAPPTVLFTVAGLGADALGAGSTPHLDRFAQEASWVGTGVTASGDGAVSLASLFTGLRPWQHGLLSPQATPSSLASPTLADLLRDAGMGTRAFLPAGFWGSDGWARSFEEQELFHNGASAAAALAEIEPGTFIWIHLDDAEPPYVIREPAARHLVESGVSDARPGHLPLSVLADWHAEGEGLGQDRLQELARVHRLELAWADLKLGGLVDVLRSGPHGASAVIAVTGSQGAPLGVEGRVLPDGGLARPEIEVPILVRWPGGPLSGGKSARASQLQLSTTLLEVAGIAPPRPGWAPGLDRPLPAAVSELYLQNGWNEISVVRGEEQWILRTWFAPPEPELHAVHVRQAGLPAVLGEPPEQILARLRHRFEATPPLRSATFRGAPPPELRRLRWLGDGGVEQVVSDAAERRAGDRWVRREWSRNVGWQRAPGRVAAPTP